MKQKQPPKNSEPTTFRCTDEILRRQSSVGFSLYVSGNEIRGFRNSYGEILPRTLMDSHELELPNDQKTILIAQLIELGEKVFDPLLMGEQTDFSKETLLREPEKITHLAINLPPSDDSDNGKADGRGKPNQPYHKKTPKWRRARVFGCVGPAIMPVQKSGEVFDIDLKLAVFLSNPERMVISALTGFDIKSDGSFTYKCAGKPDKEVAEEFGLSLEEIEAIKRKIERRATF